MRYLFLIACFGLMIMSPLFGQTVGPANGTLILAGGGLLDETVIQPFIDKAGGINASIVIIPTAGGAEGYDQSYEGLDLFRRYGVTNLTVLHTYDPQIADTDEFVEPLKSADAVWFPGGRQWRLVDAYSDTKTEAELWKLLERGGVIGGSSAGATIQGSFLVRGDTKTNTIMMGDHEEGFAFLKNVGVDQHLLRQNRQFDLIEVIEVRPELLGIGLDEGTAIMVQGDSFEVIGRSYVAIYDNRKMIDGLGKFYFLASGDRFNLATREATRNDQPVGRATPQAW